MTKWWVKWWVIWYSALYKWWVLLGCVMGSLTSKLVNEKIDEFIKFPLNAILNPNISNDEFDITTFEYIKERVKKDIESIVEDPKKYSIRKLLENMCKNTESKININGYIEDLENINNSNLFDYYKEMIKHDFIDIYIIGNLDMDNVLCTKLTNSIVGIKKYFYYKKDIPKSFLIHFLEYINDLVQLTRNSTLLDNLSKEDFFATLTEYFFSFQNDIFQNISISIMKLFLDENLDNWLYHFFISSNFITKSTSDHRTNKYLFRPYA